MFTVLCRYAHSVMKHFYYIHIVEIPTQMGEHS